MTDLKTSLCHRGVSNMPETRSTASFHEHHVSCDQTYTTGTHNLDVRAHQQFVEDYDGRFG